jgi:hypothetical protein
MSSIPLSAALLSIKQAMSCRSIRHIIGGLMLQMALKLALGRAFGHLQTINLPAPTLLTPANDSRGMPLTQMLTWSGVTGATSYQLQVSTSSNFSTYLVNQSGLTATQYELTGLTNGAKYYWRVRSQLGSNNSNWSTIWNFTTLIPAPQLVTPTNNSIDVPVNTFFTWVASLGAASYQLQVSTNSDFPI